MSELLSALDGARGVQKRRWAAAIAVDRRAPRQTPNTWKFSGRCGWGFGEVGCSFCISLALQQVSEGPAKRSSADTGNEVVKEDPTRDDGVLFGVDVS